MKTTLTMIAACAACTVGAMAAPAVLVASSDVVAADETQTISLEVTGLR